MGEQCMSEQSQSHRCRVAAGTWGKLHFKSSAKLVYGTHIPHNLRKVLLFSNDLIGACSKE